MSLRIRRGTDAERLLITPLAGELVYTTDTKEVFVGDGSTVGGRAVTSFTNEQAEVVLRETLGESDLLINNTHTGITFSYDSGLGVITAEVNEVGLGGFKTIIVNEQDDVEADETNNILTLVAGSGISITTNAAEDSITFESTGLVVVADDTTPSLGGDLDINGFRIIGNGDFDVTGTIRATDFVGTVTGDVKGSVFGDDSSILVNANTGDFTGAFNTPLIRLEGARIITKGSTGEFDPIFFVDDDAGFIRMHPREGGIELRGIIDPSAPSVNNTLQHYISRGSNISPTAVVPGDSLSGSTILAHDGGDFQFAGYNGYVVDPRYTPAPGSVKALYTIAFPDRASPDDTIFTADTDGVLSTPVALWVRPLADPATRDAALPNGVVQPGMVVFLLNDGLGSPKMQVNTDGTITGWVNLN
jgi:hypothetical protein